MFRELIDLETIRVRLVHWLLPYGYDVIGVEEKRRLRERSDLLNWVLEAARYLRQDMMSEAEAADVVRSVEVETRQRGCGL